jgi:hypothetical protein
MAAGILVVILFIGLVTPASAEKIIWDYTAYEFTDTSGYYEKSSTSAGGPNMKLDQIYMVDISLHQTLNYVVFTIPSTSVGYSDAGSLLDSGRHEFTYTLKDQNDKPLVVYIERFAASTRITMFFEDWDIESLSGIQLVDINGMYFMNVGGTGIGENSDSFKQRPMMLTLYYADDSYYSPYLPVRVDWTSGIEWQNHIKLTELNPNPLGGYEFSLTRNIDGKYSQSTCKIYNEEEIIYTDSSTTDIMDRWYSLGSITQINIESPTGRVYKFPVAGGADPSEPALCHVYIQNSQTGALIADARLSILAAAGGTETEVVNATLPGGTGTYTLQPTGPTNPNPRYYKAVATVPGFTQIVENHSFTLHGPHDVIIEMRPDSGGPLDPERAYLEFYVRDFAANPIPAASIQCGGRILQTNSAGYAVFEVPKNSTHPWIAKKSGYTTIEGTATVADGPRYVVNVVLGPGTVPTHTPTLGPGETPGGPGATPTPDTRTNEQKGQEVIDLIADFALPIAILAILATLSGLLSMMMPRRR